MQTRYPWLITVALGATVISVAALIADVFAHAEYERSIPARNEVLPEPPARVDVWFSQELFKQQGANFIHVRDETGNQVNEGDGIVDDDDRAHMYAELPAGLPSGRYVVEWMTTSADDGDTDEGAFCFYVGVEPTAEQEAACAAFEPEEAAATPTQPEPAPATPTAVAPLDGEDEDGGAPVGAIVGSVIGGIMVVALVVGGAVVWLRRKAA